MGESLWIDELATRSRYIYIYIAVSMPSRLSSFTQINLLSKQATNTRRRPLPAISAPLAVSTEQEQEHLALLFFCVLLRSAYSPQFEGLLPPVTGGDPCAKYDELIVIRFFAAKKRLGCGYLTPCHCPKCQAPQLAHPHPALTTLSNRRYRKQPL